MFLSPCIEWMIADDYPGLAERVRAAKAVGFQAAEFHLWRDKDLDAVADALDETGLKRTGFVVEPRRSIVDPAQHDEFLEAVRHGPGTGTIDWPAKVEALKKLGYDGGIGLEYKPTLPPAGSLATAERVLAI
ncbi:MAG: hypothetical protein ABIS25_04915 [Sphingomicrobium sp.]